MLIQLAIGVKGQHNDARHMKGHQVALVHNDTRHMDFDTCKGQWLHHNHHNDIANKNYQPMMKK